MYRYFAIFWALMLIVMLATDSEGNSDGKVGTIIIWLFLGAWVYSKYRKKRAAARDVEEKKRLQASAEQYLLQLASRIPNASIISAGYWETTSSLTPAAVVLGSAELAAVSAGTPQTFASIPLEAVQQVSAKRSPFLNSQSQRKKQMFSRVIEYLDAQGREASAVFTFAESDEAADFAASIKEAAKQFNRAKSAAAKSPKFDDSARIEREKLHVLDSHELNLALEKYGIRIDTAPGAGADVVVNVYHESLDKIGEELNGLPAQQMHQHIQDHVCSASLAAALRVLSSNDARAIVSSWEGDVSSVTGKTNWTCILSASYTREAFAEINIKRIDPSDSMGNFPHRMKFLKTKGLQKVAKIEADEMLVMA